MPSMTQPARQQLSQREIDAVMRRYDIGTIHEIRELPEGSVYSPKVILKTDRGVLLLKRRARGLDLPPIVAFSHEVMIGCLERGSPIPPLLGTREDLNSMVQHEDHTYELFAYIEGERFDPRNAAHAQQSGMVLSDLHRVMTDLPTSFEPSVESISVDPSRLALLEPLGGSLPEGCADDLGRMLNYGLELCQANAAPPALVHGDWHPGNLIFRGPVLVAVCDFDNTRIGSRLREQAQALVYISMRAPGNGESGSTVPAEPAKDSLTAFWSGLMQKCDPSARPDARNVLGLMPAVMIDEALGGLGTSRTSSEHAIGLLTAIWRKAAWIDHNQAQLLDALS